MASARCTGVFLGQAGVGGQRLTLPPQHPALLSLPVARQPQLPRTGRQPLSCLPPAGPQPGPEQNRGPPPPPPPPDPCHPCNSHLLSSCLPRPHCHPPSVPTLLPSVTSPPLTAFLPDTVPAHWRRTEQKQTSSSSLFYCGGAHGPLLMGSWTPVPTTPTPFAHKAQPVRGMGLSPE